MAKWNKGESHSRASQARLIGGMGDHEFPGDKKIRAHRRLKHPDSLRTPNFSLPITRFSKPTHVRRDKDKATKRLERLVAKAKANAGLKCFCTLAEDAGLFFLRPCAEHAEVMSLR